MTEAEPQKIKNNYILIKGVAIDGIHLLILKD